MENGEIHNKEIKADKNGYSEVKVDRDLELQAGQWLDLKKKKSSSVTPQQNSYRKKLRDGIQRLLQDQEEMIAVYTQGKTSETPEGEALLAKILMSQTQLKILLKSIKWDAQQKFDISKLPQEISQLLK